MSRGQAAATGAKWRSWARPALLLIPALFALLALPLGSRHFHWDTLERAYLLEHSERYLRTWDGSPRSQFLSFAHVLELPMAAIVRAVLGGGPGLRALVFFEALAAAGALLLLGRLVRFWGGAKLAAIAAQLLLSVTYGFWKMGSSGEERVVALATLLLFLFCYWGALAGERRVAWVAPTLAFAILTHLSNVVLVPFALLSLLLLPQAWKPQRRALLGGVILGAVVATGVYGVVAAWTTHVRTPLEFAEYLTFFHREEGNNFFGVPGSSRGIAACLFGILGFFSGSGPLAVVAVALLALSTVAARASRRLGASANAARPICRRFLVLHACVLAGLWTLHFAFYEPFNVESWTVPATLFLLVASALPWRGLVATQAATALLLLFGNLSLFAKLHEPMPLARYHDVVRRSTSPDDIVLLVGGIQNGQPLRGSISMRFFLAHERQRTLASLYDVMQVTDKEYWGRPLPSVETLQRELAGGRRVWFPGFLRAEFDRANQSDRIQLEFVARGDSLFEITGAGRP
ncbi:MAG: hypothetical protein JSW67_07580 [Candidatus Latescibacterota bacterium]|nr:MAG: hypothetical protein JSW67_07580 [Candidatus Latescibacterota bacterium]